MPVIVIQEVRRSVGHHNLRQRNEESSEAVERKERQIEHQPDLLAVVVLFIQEIEQELEIPVRYHQHAEQGDMVPEIDVRPELDTHAERAAGPQQHDAQQRHEGADNPLLMPGGQERQQQKQVAEDGNNGDPTISTHSAVPPFRCCLPCGSLTGR